MSIHAFGNSVEEVQRKLSEILPLVDAGAERATKLHGEIADELPKYKMAFKDIDESINKVGDLATDEGGQLLHLKAELATQQTSLSGAVGQGKQTADEALAALTEVHDRIEADVEQSSTRLETATKAVASELGTMVENANSIQQSLTTLRGKTETGFDDLSAGVDGFTSQWDTDDSNSRQSLDSLKSTVAETQTADVKKQFNGLNDSTVETAANVVELVTNHETAIGEFFAAFDTDAETLVEDFKGKAREMFGNLKDYAENQCGQVVENAMENLGKEIVEAFAAEIVTCVATTQVGVSTTAALSPIIPELAVCKKVTGAINSIL